MINKIKRLLFPDPETKLPSVDIEHVMGALSEVEGWGLKQNKISQAWELTRGEGVTVAVIDTGMPRHNDIGDNAIQGGHFVEGQDPFDNQGHQTHCVGIICAKDNDQGMVGVAPEAKALCVKGLGDNGNGSFSALTKALDYCIQERPDIVSMSLGAPIDSPAIHKRIKTLTAMNIPVVCAAGNSGDNGVMYPGKYPETIAIAAHDKYNRIAGFSSKGDTVDFTSPGVGIYSTYLKQRYARMSGTSMACPFMAGVVALLISRWRAVGKTDYTVEEIKRRLIEYSVDKGDPDKDNNWGYGTVDVPLMIKDIKAPPVKPKPEPQPEPSPLPPPPAKKPRDTKKNVLLAVGGVILMAILTQLLK